jgi:acyl dehydratase
MLRVYSKAVAGATVVPALRKVPLLGARVGAGSGQLPERELVRSQVRVDRERLAAYDRVCGFRLRDELPPTYPHIVAFPLAMELMTSSSFPFPAMGLVHIANRIELRRPLPAGEAFSLRVWAADLREHERGTQFDIRAEASVAEEPVWLSSSTYLHRERGGEKGSSARTSEEAPGAPQAIWDVPRDIGRRYGAVSGDRNPIHLHPVTAKLFGMRSHIAHGMWTKARCLAALEGELPEAYTVEVRFKLPIFLPARVGFSTWEDGDTRRFAVRDAGDGKPHLDGRMIAVPA